MNHYWSIENRMKWTGLKGDAQVKSITFKGCNLAEQKEPFDIFNIIFGTNLHNWNFILLQYLRWRCNEFWSLKRQPKKNWRYPETEQKSKRIKPLVLHFTIILTDTNYENITLKPIPIIFQLEYQIYTNYVKKYRVWVLIIHSISQIYTNADTNILTDY